MITTLFATARPVAYLSLVRRIYPMKRIIAFSITALLLGCASNSGVYRIAENTYQVSTRATWELGGRVGAMRMAMQEATNYCSEHGGKKLKVIKYTDDYGHFQGGIVNLTFSCE